MRKITDKRLQPSKVESVFVAHDAVAEAGVAGVSHEVKGEVVANPAVVRAVVEAT